MGNLLFYGVLSNKRIFCRIVNNGLNVIEYRITATPLRHPPGTKWFVGQFCVLLCLRQSIIPTPFPLLAHNDVKWVPWRLESPEPCLFVQQPVQTSTKERKVSVTMSFLMLKSSSSLTFCEGETGDILQITLHPSLKDFFRILYKFQWV